MRTTIDISEPLFAELRRAALRKRTTPNAIIEASLRQFLKSERSPRKPFRLNDGSFGGHGVQPGIQEGDWQQVRELIYEGRGA